MDEQLPGFAVPEREAPKEREEQSPPSRPILRVVDGEGQLHDQCPGCQMRDDEIEGLETEKAGWRKRYQDLKRDEEAMARTHAQWPEAVALWRFWQEKCNHPRSEFTAKRFELVLPHLNTYGAEACREAIRGAAYDPYTTERKNGTTAIHNGWELIFRSQAKVEEFQARAPVERQPFRKRSLEDHCAEVASRVLERARLIEEATDPGTLASLLAEVHRLNLKWLATPDEYIS